MFGFFQDRRRKMLLAQPLPREWREHLARNVAIYHRLPPAQQQKLLAAARIIASERRFVGCKGLMVTEDMKITIAAQAALLLLGEEGYYFDRVTSFLLYPYKMILPQQGVRPTSDERDFDERVILGQAVQHGEIILSWPDVLSGGRVADDGENVVLHELAHHLDGLDGQMGGSPPGLARDRQDHFHQVFERALDQLRRDLADGVDTVLPDPAAESTAELFAWSTECYFERPVALAQQYPDLFDCLREFYKVDPSEWFSGYSAVTHGSEDEDEDEQIRAPRKDLPTLETADEYFARGQEHFSAGQWSLAAADFNRCVRMNPADQEALFWRGRAALYQDHVDAALADADRACRLDPTDQEAHCLRAMCLVAHERYRDALDEFLLAGTCVADEVEALFLRGLARGECDDWIGALSDFCDVIDEHPDDAEAWYQRALCHDRLGRAAEAERDLAKARQLGWEEDGENERQRDGENEG